MTTILLKGERCASVRAVGLANNVVRGVAVSFAIFHELHMAVVIPQDLKNKCWGCCFKFQGSKIFKTKFNDYHLISLWNKSTLGSTEIKSPTPCFV